MAGALRGTLLSIAISLFFIQITLAELVVKPTDTETLIGELTYFNCSTSVVSQAIQWFHSSAGVIQERSIVYGYDQFYDPYKGRFMIEKNEATGTFNLIIESVNAQDAGSYECQDDVGRGAKASARLIVLDKIPHCESNPKTSQLIGPNSCDIPLGELQLTCSATYHGDDVPVLKWFQDGSDQPLNDGASFSSAGNRSLSYLTLKSDKVKNGSSFNCKTTRSRPTSYGCKSGSVKLISGTNPTCPATRPYVDAIVVIILLLVPIIIAASLVGGICLQKRLKICERIDIRHLRFRKLPEENTEQRNVEAAPTREELVPLKSDVTEKTETVVLPDDIANITKEQYEKLRRQIHELQKRNQEQEVEIGQLEKKIRHLEDEQRELEERLYPSANTIYSTKPKLVSMIEIKDSNVDPKKKSRPIFGMAILGNKLFIITEKSTEIEVYDSVTFNEEPRWSIAAMSNPLDIASCNKQNCLYIFDNPSDSETTVLRVDDQKPISRFLSVGKDACQLSVTKDGNVVVSFFKGNKIMEYSPDGKLIRTISLSPADNIKHPWHAIKTTSMHFIFSHGIGDDQLQRVCVANANEKIIKSFGGKKGTDIKEKHMNRPVHLLEDSSRNILVADIKNKRVLLLSPTLEYRRILVSADTSKLRFPMRLCLDEERGILFVADNNYKEKVYSSGRILIFNCKT